MQLPIQALCALMLSISMAHAHGGGPYRGPGDPVPPVPGKTATTPTGPTTKGRGVAHVGWRSWWAEHAEALQAGLVRHRVASPPGSDDAWIAPHAVVRRPPTARLRRRGADRAPPPPSIQQRRDPPSDPDEIRAADALALGWRGYRRRLVGRTTGLWTIRDPEIGIALARICRDHPDRELRAQAAVALALGGFEEHVDTIAHAAAADPSLSAAARLVAR